MCGIAGIVDLYNSNASNAMLPRVEAMCQAMAHRGPNGQGIWRDTEQKCVLGHRRLSIIDLTTASSQPMLSHDKRYVLSFNGEIYNFKKLRIQLEQKGISINSAGDSEILLEWIALKGIEGLGELQGMFAFAIWDRKTKSLILARDPLGIKPCYYAILNDTTLVFASEVRAILASGLIERKVDNGGLRSFLSYGSAQGPQTICKEIKELLASQTLEFSEHGTKTSFYWKPNYPYIGTKPKEYDDDEFRFNFDSAVTSHLISDVPLGAFLSGGIDSSAIVASMAISSNVDIHTLCVELPSDTPKADAYYAKIVAGHLRTKHSEIKLTHTELNEWILQAIAAMDQPTIDAINTYIVSKAAKDSGLTVALSGLGGDELFGGYTGFAKIPRIAKRIEQLNNTGLMYAKPLIKSLVKLNPQSRIAHRLIEFLSLPPDVKSVYREYYRNFTDTEVDWLLNTSRMSVGSSIPDDRWSQIADLCEGLKDLDIISWLELTFHMGNTMLRDTDTMSMASSLEVRVPLLDTLFVQYAQSLVQNVREFNKKKFVLTNTMRERLPVELFQRSKQGFWMPMDRLIMYDLRNTVEECIFLGDKLCFRGKAQMLWKQYNRNPKSVGWKRIWTIVVLASWLIKHEVQITEEER